MYKRLLKFFLPDSSESFLENEIETLKKINNLEDKIKKMSQEEMKNRLKELKNKDPLSILPEVFAIVREVSLRTLLMRHFDVQVLGAIGIFKGYITELKTGEGKTLVVTMPAVLGVISGYKVHIATANSYLAERDCSLMSHIYNYLGLNCSFVNENMSRQEIISAYSSDILYAHSRDLVTIFLRDQLVNRKELKIYYNIKTGKIEKIRLFLIVDEADYCLKEEATVPSIMTTFTNNKNILHHHFSEILEQMSENVHYTIEYKNNTSNFTETGLIYGEKILKDKGLLVGNLYSKENSYLYKYLKNALFAKVNLRENIDYVVLKNKIVIIDKQTGRLAVDRHFSDGLNNSLAAKHNLAISPDSKTIASSSYFVYFGSNYFNRNKKNNTYEKVAGLTGTASYSSDELNKLYNLNVVVIPPNTPSQRVDYPPRVYRYKKDLYEDLKKEVLKTNKTGQPILIGTFSVEESEIISNLLSEVEHTVLNAKNHALESKIIANAGKKNSITIATNMAGRGTDIKLGGNYMDEFEANKHKYEDQEAYQKELSLKYKEEEKIINELGGLCVIVVTAPESPDFYLQLIGRSGRQGQKGKSLCFYSFEDMTLMHLLKEPINMAILENLYPENVKYLEKNNYVYEIIEKIQNNINKRDTDSRLHLYKISSIVHFYCQLKIYNFRDNILVINYPKSLALQILNEFFVDLEKNTSLINSQEEIERNIFINTGLRIKTYEDLKSMFIQKIEVLSEESVRDFLLESLDDLTGDFLENIEDAKKSIYLSNFSQSNPINDFKKTSSDIFRNFIEKFRIRSITNIIEGKTNNNFKDMQNIFEEIPCTCKSGKPFVNCCGKNLSESLLQ